MYMTEVFEVGEKSNTPPSKKRKLSEKEKLEAGKAFFAEVLNVVESDSENDNENVGALPITPPSVCSTPDDIKSLKKEELAPETQLEELPSANLLSQPPSIYEVPDTHTAPDTPLTPEEEEEEESTPESPSKPTWKEVDTQMLPPPSPQANNKAAPPVDQADLFRLVPAEEDILNASSPTESVRRLLWEEDEVQPVISPVVQPVISPVVQQVKERPKRRSSPGYTVLQVEDALRWCATHGRPHRNLLAVVMGDEMEKAVMTAADSSRVFRIALLAFLIVDRCELPGPLTPPPDWQICAMKANATAEQVAAFYKLAPSCVRCRLQWAKSLLASVGGTLSYTPANSPFLPPPIGLRSDFTKLHSSHSCECPIRRK